MGASPLLRRLHCAIAFPPNGLIQSAKDGHEVIIMHLINSLYLLFQQVSYTYCDVVVYVWLSHSNMNSCFFYCQGACGGQHWSTEYDSGSSYNIAKTFTGSGKTYYRLGYWKGLIQQSFSITYFIYVVVNISCCLLLSKWWWGIIFKFDWNIRAQEPLRVKEALKCKTTLDKLFKTLIIWNCMDTLTAIKQYLAY